MFDAIMWTTAVVAPVSYFLGSTHAIGKLYGYAKEKFSGLLSKNLK